MQRILTSKLNQLFRSGRPVREATNAEVPIITVPEFALGLDHIGTPVENPMRTLKWHCLILGATGTGKTSLTKRLVANLNCRVIWLETQNPEVEALLGAINRRDRFELPVLLVIDDAHLFTEQLDLIERVARDGRKSNVFLLITAQLLTDLPQPVWRNCQVRFALDAEANEQLKVTTHEQAVERVIAFCWPGRRGLFQLTPPSALHEVTAIKQGNPLLRRASTPQLAPSEEFAPTRQTPLDQWSMEELAEPQDLHDRQHGSTGLPHRTRYSRTL